MAKKRTNAQPGTRRLVFVPERKISETILDFAVPLLEPLGPVPRLDEARGVLELAINVWNLHVTATELWGKPEYLAEARKVMCGPASPPGLGSVFEALSERRRSLFANDHRCVGDWTLGPDGAGGHALVCDARLPNGCEPYAPPRAETRIFIGGRPLDAVQVRQSPTAHLAFPPERHRAEIKDDIVVLHVPAPVIAQLFADGILPPIGHKTVEIVVYAQPARRMVLAELSSSDRSKVAGDVLSLTFRPEQPAPR